ncbi:MAG: hypothetical protein ABR567_04895 [Myxococcales bacterium]
MILAFLLAAQAQVLAVLEFRDEVPPAERINTAYLSDQVRAAAKQALPSMKVITRENMLVLLRASGKDLANCEGECEVDTARRIGADAVVSGELLRFGTQYKLNMKLHDARSGELLSGAVAAGTTADGLDRSVAQACEKLFAPLRSEMPALQREGGLLGLQLHGAFGYGSQSLGPNADTSLPVASGQGATAIGLGLDLTWHALPSLWIGPWLDLIITRANYISTDSLLVGALARTAVGRLWLAGGLGYAALRDQGGWTVMVEGDYPLWKVFAVHAQLVVARGAVGIGITSGDDTLYAATAGISLVF